MSQTEDMKEMIRRELQSISALEERVVFKELMEGIFLSLYEKNEEMYRKLEKRVMDDLAYNINQYRIRTGLIEKAYIDQSHHLMTAMCKEDTRTKAYTVADLRSAIAKQGEVCLTTIFLQGDALDINQFLKQPDAYSGILKAEKEYPAAIRIEPSRRYLNKLEHLYHLFMKNGVPWKTVNAPYLFKMMDVILTALPEEASDRESIRGFSADFGSYNHLVRYDMVPIWNVWHLQLESAGFPIACKDHENYEHVISIQDYGPEHAYLVEEKTGIRQVRHSGDRLIVTGQIANAKRWDVYMIKNGEDSKIDRYTYPVMENLRRDGFAERFQRRNGAMVKTKCELERFIRGFGLEDFIEYQDCALSDSEVQPETYSMNFFIKDEIRESKGRRKLNLYFKNSGREPWLARDIASFIASEVQELYPEYQCGGLIL